MSQMTKVTVLTFEAGSDPGVVKAVARDIAVRLRDREPDKIHQVVAVAGDVAYVAFEPRSAAETVGTLGKVITGILK